MGKIHSLQKLKEMGLNTPKLLYQCSQFSPPAQKIKGWMMRVPEEETVSIRTERDGDTSCPHFPNIDVHKADRDIRWLARQGYAIYVFEGINPNHCERRGNMAFRAKDVVIEYMEGPGTVRDLEKANAEEIKTVVLQGSTLVPEKLLPICVSIGKRWKDMEGQILEWSLYKYPLGELYKKDIYWELRPWS